MFIEKVLGLVAVLIVGWLLIGIGVIMYNKGACLDLGYPRTSITWDMKVYCANNEKAVKL